LKATYSHPLTGMSPIGAQDASERLYFDLVGEPEVAMAKAKMAQRVESSRALAPPPQEGMGGVDPLSTGSRVGEQS
jgi:hypothetical protein